MKFNREDYELVEGKFECEGCAFNKNDDCLVRLGTPSFNAFQGCQDEGPIYADSEFPDPDELIYLIFKKI